MTVRLLCCYKTTEEVPHDECTVDKCCACKVEVWISPLALQLINKEGWLPACKECFELYIRAQGGSTDKVAG